MHGLYTRTSFLTPSVALLGLLALTGCPDDGPETLTPTITSFSANPTSVASGGTTTLSWETSDADDIKISSGSATLTQSTEATGTFTTAALTADTTFTLEATNDSGSVSKTVTVTVGGAGAPTVDSFAANPTAIDPGASSTLSWMTTNAISVNIMEGANTLVTDGDADGSFMVTPDATTTYTVVAKNAAGDTAMAMVTVTVNAAPAPTVATFTANPAAVDPGDSATLSWNVMNADTIEITDGAGTSVYSGSEAMGTVSVSPAATTTYTLTATNQVGTDSDTFTVSVNPPMGAAVDAFTANPSTVMLGMGSDLSWMVQRADAVEIMAGGAVLNTSTSQSGTFTVTPTITTEYTLMARNPAGDAMAMQTVTVTAGAPVVTDFSASPNPVNVEAMTTLSWSVIGADNVRVLDGTTELANTAMNVGSVMASVTSTMTVFTLEVSNQTGGNTAQVIVYGHYAPSINGFTATPGVLTTATATITLTWDASDVQDLTLTANGTPVPGFTVIANPMLTTNETGSVDMVIAGDTTFVLTAASQGGMASQTVTVLRATLELEPNNDAGTALAVAGGSPILGSINPGDDTDWYQVVVPAGGYVRAFTDDGNGGCPFDTNLTLTSTDGVTTLVFDDDDGVGNCSLIEPTRDAPARNMAAGTYYLSVGSYQANTGDYTLTLEVGAPGCGNGVLETGEMCDDANVVAGDGCDASCGFEPLFTYSAPGAQQLDAGNMVSNLQVDIMQITVTSTSYLFAETLTSTSPPGCTVDTILRLYAADGLTQLGSDDFDGVSSCSLIDASVDSFATLAPGQYWLTVEEDGKNASIGNYFLQVLATPIGVCGNFVAEGNEQCDDGNAIGGDGCDANCQVEAAGTYSAPGAAQTFAMQSIDPIGEQDVYVVNVTADSYLFAETFEDAVAGTCTFDTLIRLFDANGVQLGTDDDDGVNACSRFGGSDAFARLAPGSYFVQVEEFGNNGLIARYDLVLEGVPADVCGNGVVEATNSELCDDGNTQIGDGCDATCIPEPLGQYTAPGAPQTFANQSIDPIGQQDVFFVTVTAESYIVAETFEDAVAGTCTFDTVIRLFDALGTELGSDDEGGVNSCSRFDGNDAFARVMPGIYGVVVEDYLNNGLISRYDLVLEGVAVDVCGNGYVDGTTEVCDDGNTTAGDGCDATCQIEGTIFTEIEPNGSTATANDPGLTAIGQVTASGVVDLGNDQDFYVFTVPAGGADLNVITYTTAGNTATCASGTDTEVFLYDSAGTEITSNDDGNPAGNGLCSNLNRTAMAAGTYYISVEYYSRTLNPSNPFPYLVDITLQ